MVRRRRYERSLLAATFLAYGEGASQRGLLAPGVGVDVDGVAVLGEAVDEGAEAGGVLEDRAPLLVGEVRRQDDRLLLVATADDVEEQVGCAAVAGHVAQFVQD